MNPVLVKLIGVKLQASSNAKSASGDSFSVKVLVDVSLHPNWEATISVTSFASAIVS